MKFIFYLFITTLSISCTVDSAHSKTKPKALMTITQKSINKKLISNHKNDRSQNESKNLELQEQFLQEDDHEINLMKEYSPEEDNYEDSYYDNQYPKDDAFDYEFHEEL